MDIYKLEKILSKYEGPKLDFKACLKIDTESEKKEFAKDVIAIANSKGGRGYIIFGVEDKTKKILGIKPNEYDEEKIQQIICSRVDPPVTIAVDILDYKGKKIAVLTIFRSYQQPHQMTQTGAFYIRRGSTTDFARREEIAGMFQLSGLFSYESTILRKASIEDFNKTLLNKYLNRLGVTGEHPSDIILEGLGIIGRNNETGGYNPTVGGILLFGKEPSKYLTHNYIKVVNDDVKYFCGNIFNMVGDTCEYLKLILGKDYPIKMLFYAVTNSVVHRDYTDITRGICIEINEKNIVVSNPGALLSGNLIYKIEKDKDTRKRNPWLYQRLLSIEGDYEFLQQGPGLTKIKQEFKGARFLNVGSQNLFKVILPR